MFVSRSSREKPSPFERCVRTTSPSRYSTAAPRASSSRPTISAIVDLPAPERPVNQITTPAVTSRGCRTRSCRSPPSARPARPRPAVTGRVQGMQPDGRVAPVVQRVVRDLVDGDVRLDALGVPVDERVDLPDVVALAPLDLLGVLAGQALLAADPGDPGVVGLERALERLDLADVAAAVGVALPQVRPLLAVLLGDRDDLRPDQLRGRSARSAARGSRRSRRRRGRCRARRRGRPGSSSETMCTSTDDCFCHEHVRQSLSPNSEYAQRRTSSADIASKSTSGR